MAMFADVTQYDEVVLYLESDAKGSRGTRFPDIRHAFHLFNVKAGMVWIFSQ